MIVLEIEEKKYGETMKAVSKIKEYAECLEEILEEHSIGYRGSMGYRGKEKRKPWEHEYDYSKGYEERYM